MDEPTLLTEIIKLNSISAGTAQKVDDVIGRLDKMSNYIVDKHNKLDAKDAELEKQINEINTNQTVTTWKIGTISAGAGALLIKAVDWLAGSFWGTKPH